MNNFNFIYHPEQACTINLDQVLYFVPDSVGALDYVIKFVYRIKDDTSEIFLMWHWKKCVERNKVFNALLKLTSQNLCSAASPWTDPPRTDHSMLMRNTEKRQPHPETNPF